MQSPASQTSGCHQPALKLKRGQFCVFSFIACEFKNSSMELQELIEKAWADRELLKSEETQTTIRKVVELLDKGQLRVAEPEGDGWRVNEWIKKAVIMYFPIQQMN